ncbi:Hypothetical protein CINCED_3A001582 [Cinara cedri]|uniref:Uncharacterized protein n=1 Tax=Cinara cedri TaxID=506608 RepID=A0A5E4MR51_9HEMI|nr:Hypothetical protein CINCED_3A001582 [Cinara cedri]
MENIKIYYRTHYLSKKHQGFHVGFAPYGKDQDRSMPIETRSNNFDERPTYRGVNSVDVERRISVELSTPRDVPERVTSSKGGTGAYVVGFKLLAAKLVEAKPDTNLLAAATLKASSTTTTNTEAATSATHIADPLAAFTSTGAVTTITAIGQSTRITSNGQQSRAENLSFARRQHGDGGRRQTPNSPSSRQRWQQRQPPKVDSTG